MFRSVLEFTLIRILAIIEMARVLRLKEDRWNYWEQSQMSDFSRREATDDKRIFS